MTIKEKLQNRLGYILDDEIEEMINEFGKDYKVVIKYYSNPREFISLERLKTFSDTNPELNNDIREVFISSDEYRRLFGEI